MKSLTIGSLEEFENKLSAEKRSFLLIYKSGSEQSDLAIANLDIAAEKLSDIGLFTVDVNRVKDVHPAYSIASAPSWLEFKEKEFKNVYKGAHGPAYYRGLFENAEIAVGDTVLFKEYSGTETEFEGKK